MIHLDHVHLAFRDDVVLDDVSLRVQPGELTCLFGPSGCGKSTILNVIAGAAHPQSGHVTVETRKIGYVFQDDRLLPWRTVRENMLVALSGAMERQNAESTTERWLERVGLTRAADLKPGALSGGMKRKLNLARALAVEPELLLLDEPFAFLDPEAVAVVRREIRDAQSNRGATVVIVSHVREHVATLNLRIVPVTGPPVTLNA